MKNRTMVGAVATVAVVALVIAGLFAVGSPATARKFKADQERRNRLSQVHYVLAGHVREEGSLPRSLEEVDDEVLRQSGSGFDTRKDPATGEFFEYRRLTDRRYEVCAQFETSSDDNRSQEFGPYPGDLEHEAGRACFERRITDQDVDSAPGFIPGIGEELIRPKVPPAPPNPPTPPSGGPAPGTTDAPPLGDPGIRSSSPVPTPSPV